MRGGAVRTGQLDSPNPRRQIEEKPQDISNDAYLLVGTRLQKFFMHNLKATTQR